MANSNKKGRGLGGKAKRASPYWGLENNIVPKSKNKEKGTWFPKERKKSGAGEGGGLRPQKEEGRVKRRKAERVLRYRSLTCKHCCNGKGLTP